MRHQHDGTGGRQRHGMFDISQRIGGPCRREQELRPCEQRIGHLRIDRQALIESRQRLAAFTLLGQRHPQQIQQHRVAAIAFQRHPIKPLGLHQIALAVVRKRLIDELLRSHLRERVRTCMGRTFLRRPRRLVYMSIPVRSRARML